MLKSKERQVRLGSRLLPVPTCTLLLLSGRNPKFEEKDKVDFSARFLNPPILCDMQVITVVINNHHRKLIKRIRNRKEDIKLQTPGGAGAGYNNAAGSYVNQNWQQGSYVNYGNNNQYASYAPEATAAAPTQQYQQSYNQWADYYSQTEVSCAPGTENVVSTGTANAVHSVPGVPGVPGGYVASNTQQPATFAAPWRPDSSSSDVITSVQHGAAISNVQDGYWKHGTPTFQTQSVGHVQSNVRTPLDSNHTYAGYQEQHKPVHPQGGYQEQHKTVHPQVSGAQYPATHQLPYNYYTSLQTVSPTVQQTVPQSVQQTASQNIPFDSRVSKMQIPTNPRIATNLVLGLSKIDKDNSVSGAAVRPLYVSVAPPKTNSEVTSHVGADSILKPGMFPNSLRGYVERALSRCKDDKQMAACQEVMKEVITKATADGTLYTRNWDMEPLFPIPSADRVNNEALQSSTPVSSLTNNRRSPSRRSKSRWEPLSVDKLVDKQPPHTPDTKYSGWFNQSEGGKFSAGRVVKENNWGHLKFTSSDPKVTNKVAQRPAKRQCLGDGPSGGDNGGGASSDSDEQSLTAYYAGAVALADTPEEKKRRESRSKRFEKARGNRSANSYSRPKTVGAGLYTKRTNALVLKKDFEEGNSRAVEDIDWDSLTVKGTCQEVEKRYLRLTSAPDPATVRPEEVLEKALLMVQGSQKNYLHKCDQLKSIRQDLTVQRIRNELTVKVYETHARLAIEVGDLSEYNQCQSQLQVLYAEGNKGCIMEFSAYNLLCVILHSNNNRDLLSAMSKLPVDARKDEAVKHALAVRAAVTSGNYVLFFRLYKEAPNLGTCLMDLYVEKMRYAAVKCMSRSYRPTLPVAYIAQVLGFSSVSSTAEPSDEKDIDAIEECAEWLKAHGACLITDNPDEVLLDSKASTSSLFMPEPEDAVAHGDATLAVNDFLTRVPS
ncbi:SAC3 family protein A [Heracleum sosnowskyi]|uniref:SAC3 family protein A n=1 Tax=Heracleum sosnowskyi TaxID=360622 RepID=A0AAD8ICX2_9APIA|nr:SAC3 family protein A [Heracleum sosnowskyi]